ncbi:restriction endonuclease subunit S [Croceibacter atlanticus]|uniref:restriction endonuclease subunit S n=1 Tax=Croceibacter atlanticus TaxID=313588 RepID=UPI0024B899E6|nr:restriction endonuclease subunit S [Croceibacter atlanticus]
MEKVFDNVLRDTSLEKANNWKEEKVEDLIEIKYGKDHKKLNEGNIPCFGSGGLMRYVDAQLYDDESILIPRKGSLNNIMYQNNPFWTVDTMFWSKIDKTKVFPKFLFYQLTLIDYTILNVGSAVPSLTVSVLNDIDVTLPPLPEQKAIANVLSSLDNKIDLLHKQNKTLEALAKTSFRQWFDELDFDSTILDLIQVQNGYAFKSKDFVDVGFDRVIKIKNISNNMIDITASDFISTEVANKTNSKFKITTGDILFAMTGAEIGKMGIVETTEVNLWLNQRVGLFKEKYQGSKFLAYLCLQSDFGQDYIEHAATGSAQPNISSTGIEACPFPKLSSKEIKEYSNQLLPLYKKVIFNLGEIKTLEKLRDTLLPKLMSGEVSVKQ